MSVRVRGAIDRAADYYNIITHKYGERETCVGITSLVLGILYGRNAFFLCLVGGFYPNINEKYNTNRKIYDFFIYLSNLELPALLNMNLRMNLSLGSPANRADDEATRHRALSPPPIYPEAAAALQSLHGTISPQTPKPLTEGDRQALRLNEEGIDESMSDSSLRHRTSAFDGHPDRTSISEAIANNS